MSRNVTQRIRSWLLNSLKANAFSKCAVQNQVLHVDLDSAPRPPQVEPCAEMANRRRSSDRLRGRELSPCVASTSDLHFHMLMVQRGGFGVSILSWDLCLKGSFYRGQPSRGRLIRNPLRMCIRDPLGPQGACSSKEKSS